MSVVTFIGTGSEQAGKSASLVAIATHMAISNNKRILILNTGLKDRFMDNCYFQNKKVKRNLGLFGPNTNIAMEEGISGLSRIMKSNKLSPELVTNYTKIVLKDRLEVLQSFKGNRDDYNEIAKNFSDIIMLANNYYDIVFVDLDEEVGNYIKDEIIDKSSIVVSTLNQRLTSLDKYIELKQQSKIYNSPKNLILIGRYDKYSKYNIKNISRYLHEKNNVITIPYNTLFFEACEESGVVDLFLRIKMNGQDRDDRNTFFINEVERAADAITYRMDSIKQMRI